MSDKSIVPIPDPDSKPQSFDFKGNPVRVTPDDNGEPLFVGGDVCKSLAYANTSKAISDNVDPEDKRYAVVENGVIGGVTTRYDPSLNQILLVTESGLYALIFGSSKEEAKRFKRWVTNDVLPAIRKTGQYTIQPRTQAEVALMHSQIIVDHERQLTQHGERLDLLEAKVNTSGQYFTIIGYFNLRKLIPPTRDEAASYGKRASALSRSRGISIGKETDPRFGEVGSYHVSILDELFGGSHDRQA